MPAPTRPPTPPPPGRRPAQRDHDHGPPWRERLPEVAAVMGTTLVAVATAGLVQAGWDDVGHGTRALLLGAAAVGATAAGLRGERSTRRGAVVVASLVLVAGTALTVGAVTLATAVAVPGVARVSIAAGGLAGLVHAGVLLRRRPLDGPLATAAWAAGAWAAGPFGRALSDRFGDHTLEGLGTPVVGFLDPTVTSELHLATGVGHLVLGMLALAARRGVAGDAQRVLRLLGVGTIAFAALELNVLASPVGAVAALGIVLGLLLHAIAVDDGVLLVAASTAVLAAGVRVLAAVLSGQVLATVLLLAGGLGLLGWALHAMRGGRAAAGDR